MSIFKKYPCHKCKGKSSIEHSFISARGSEQKKYPIDRRRNAGAKPRNIELSLDKTPVAEKSGRTIAIPTE
ncbi:hypothetical protein ACJIZ3_015035 [Penstemon smallii]|uniref:Uncharacterized protein n=1 Tax=Penstemon smallii TaxID=265156 RepID=A0ABD3RLC8_9LAMI